LAPIKKFLSQRGDIVADERTNALIVSDIPAVLPQIDRIIQQMDRKTQEVEIEARVVAATRNFARDIGVQLGFGWGNGTTAVGGAPAVGNSPLIANGLTQSRVLSRVHSPGSIPLFSNLGATGSEQRSVLYQRHQQHADRHDSDSGRVTRLAESSFPSAHRYAEQHSGGGETGL
jgi:type II secretory pathway component GspD/PulD (secretin)